MNRIFFWLSNPDKQHGDKWQKYLGDMGAVHFAGVALFTVIILVLYSSAARKRKIYTVDQVFDSYEPMGWLILAAVAGILVGGWAGWHYHDPEYVPAEAGGLVGTAISIGVATALLVLVLSWALIALLPALTPRKFKYRPRTLL